MLIMPKTTVITPKGVAGQSALLAVWHYRHVLRFLLLQDLLVRYKQTVVGVLWVLVQPLLEALLLTLVFRETFHSDISLPYSVFAFSGIILWTYFSSTVQRATTCIVGSAPLLKRMYMPKILLPLSIAISRLVDLGIALLALLVLLLYHNIALSPDFFLLVPLIFLTVLAAMGCSLWCSILHAYYRDVGLVVPYLMRILLFITPILYPMNILPSAWHLVIALNPLVGITIAVRSVLAGQPFLWNPVFGISCGVTLLLLLSGMLCFQRLQRNILDTL